MLKTHKTFKKMILLLTVLCATLLPASGAPTEWKDCYASLENEVLTMGNRAVRREFKWNNSHLISQSISNPLTGQTLTMKDKTPDFSLGKNTDKTVAGAWSAQVVESPVAPPHLQITVTTTYENLELRRIFRIYPDSPVIGCDYFVRAKKTPVSDFTPQESILQSIALPGTHWKYQAMEFFDRTDSNNNLVAETSALAYSSVVETRGNLLLATNLLDNTGVFMVKEAPCSFAQLHYPDYDFAFSFRSVNIVGAGIEANDIGGPNEEWMRIYGQATGVCEASEESFKIALRSYQKNLRTHLPERDEMIMMNTWGDRNRDARVGEEFVNKQVDACVRLGVSHLQIDDGWQQGLSKNSAESKGKLWDMWKEENWQPHAERFPNGFAPVVRHAKEKGIELGLWFHPSNADNYANWKQDAQVIINLYRNFGIRYFKIDGIKLPAKKAETNLRNLLGYVQDNTEGKVVFNLDATADNRGGYHWMYEYGNIFLENRYTDFGRYYPHWTLRNLWMLSNYVPAENLQIEFLNKWRNPDKYTTGDPLAPLQIPFDYQFAITMMAQPLAWFEGSELPPEAFEIAPIIKTWRQHQTAIHKGTILPIGSEPSGTSWTGFQSLSDKTSGYVLVFREYNETPQATLKTIRLADKTIQWTHLCGHGKDFTSPPDNDGKIIFALPDKHTFALYRYAVIEPKQ